MEITEGEGSLRRIGCAFAGFAGKYGASAENIIGFGGVPDNDKTRAFAKRYYEKTKREPTMNQAGYYSATMTYLNAVKDAGTTDSDKVMAELHKMKIDDMFTSNGKIRADGLMEHDMYIMQVKKPDESKYPWDYYRLIQTMSGEEAFGKLSESACPLAAGH